MEITTNMYGISFGSIENVLKVYHADDWTTMWTNLKTPLNGKALYFLSLWICLSSTSHRNGI